MASFIQDEGKAYRVWQHSAPYALEIERLNDGARAHFQGDDALQLDADLEAAAQADERGDIPGDAAPCDYVCTMYDDVLLVTH